MAMLMIIVGLIVWIYFMRSASSKKPRSGKNPKSDRQVIVKHRGKMKRYRVNKYGELYEQ